MIQARRDRLAMTCRGSSGTLGTGEGEEDIVEEPSNAV